MKRVGAFLSFVVVFAFLSSPVRVEAKNLAIQWHHHSMFEIRSSEGTIVVIDPHVIEVYYRDLKPTEAHAVLITHPHTDHDRMDRIKNRKTVKRFDGVKRIGRFRATWNNLDEEKFKDMKFSTVPLYHDSDRGKERGIVSAFVIEVDGYRIAHLSDVGHILTPAQVRLFGQIDILMIPVGGVYTINGKEAKQVVEQLKPRVAIFPMHYGTKEYDYVLEPKEFLEGQKNVETTKGSTKTFEVGAKPPEKPKVIMLLWEPKK